MKLLLIDTDEDRLVPEIGKIFEIRKIHINDRNKIHFTPKFENDSWLAHATFDNVDYGWDNFIVLDMETGEIVFKPNRQELKIPDWMNDRLAISVRLANYKPALKGGKEFKYGNTKRYI